MPPGLTLRPANARDAGAIAALHADSWRRNYRGAYSDSYLDADVDGDRLAVWTARLERPDPRVVTMLAESHDVVVGFVHVLVDHDPRWGSLIENLHVSRSRQREGIGRRLMSGAAKEVERASTPVPVHLWVLQQNLRAQSFYRALGGTCVEEAPCPAPGGVPDRLNGAPRSLRFVWQSAADLR